MSEWKKVGNEAEFELNKPKSFVLENERICVVRTAEGFYAIEDRCSHAEVRLSDGWVEGTCVACPWHGAQFDLKTGEALSRPAILPVETYLVEADEQGVRVLLAGSDNAPKGSSN